jgi:hypothetical protein
LDPEQVGKGTGMTDNNELRSDAAESEAVQGVVDRVLSWHPGAPIDTVRQELEDGLSKVGETMPDGWVQQTAERISRADPAQR